jgi:O-Antigen ligase
MVSSHRASIFALLFALAFVGFPFVSAFASALGIYSQVLSIVLRAIVLGLALATMIAAERRVFDIVWRDSAVRCFLLLWVALTLRFVWDATFVPIPLPLPWIENFLMVFGIAFIPALALFHVPDSSPFDNARRWIMVLGTLAGVFVAIAFVRAFTSGDALLNLSRLSTESLNPITTGHVGVGVVITAWMAERGVAPSGFQRLLDSKLVRATCGIIGLLLVIASASKGPMVALLAAIFTAQLAQWLRQRTWQTFVRIPLSLIGLLVLLGLLAWVISSLFGLSLVDRITDIASDTSTTDRFGMLSRALQQFEESPLFGSSIVELESRIYPHNLLADVLMVSGVFGFLLLLGVLAFSVRAYARILMTSQSWIAMVYSQYFVGAMFSGSAYFDPQFWCITATVLGIDRILNRAQPTDSTQIAVPVGAN